jgi:hypothetical protein
MNMNENLKAFIDNEVSDLERAQILKEMESNPQMQAEIIELRQMSRVIKEEAWQPQPVGLERTLNALSSPTAQKRRWWINTLALIGAGACCLMLAAILFPVFAQSKMAASATAMRYEFKTAGGVEGEAPVSSPAEHQPADSDATIALKAPQSDYAKAKADSNGRPIEGGKSERWRVYGDDVRAPQSPAAANPPAVSQPRYQIKTANLAVEVEDVSKSQQMAESIAKAVGGRVESSQKSNDEGSLASAELTFRVPVGSFETAVNRIRKLGRVLNDALTGEDVTAQVVDTQARLKVMRAEEDQYVELLKATKKIGEVLSVKERLSQVRQEIEGLDAQQKTLRDQAAESTINLSLSEKPKPGKPKQNDNWFEDVWANAIGGLNGVGRFLGSAAIFLFVFSPIWLPIGLASLWFYRRSMR